MTADLHGVVKLVHTKSVDLATMLSADETSPPSKSKLPAIKGKGKENKPNNMEKEDTQAKITKALSGIKTHTNEQHGARSVVCLRAHETAEETVLVAMSVDSLLRVLDALTLKTLYTLSGSVCRGPNACLKCAWSPDGRLVAAGKLFFHFMIAAGELIVWLHSLPPFARF